MNSNGRPPEDPAEQRDEHQQDRDRDPDEPRVYPNNGHEHRLDIELGQSTYHSNHPNNNANHHPGVEPLGSGEQREQELEYREHRFNANQYWATRHAIDERERYPSNNGYGSHANGNSNGNININGHDGINTAEDEAELVRQELERQRSILEIQATEERQREMQLREQTEALEREQREQREQLQREKIEPEQLEREQRERERYVREQHYQFSEQQQLQQQQPPQPHQEAEHHTASIQLSRTLDRRNDRQSRRPSPYPPTRPTVPATASTSASAFASTSPFPYTSSFALDCNPFRGNLRTSEVPPAPPAGGAFLTFPGSPATQNRQILQELRVVLTTNPREWHPRSRAELGEVEAADAAEVGVNGSTDGDGDGRPEPGPSHPRRTNHPSTIPPHFQGLHADVRASRTTTLDQIQKLGEDIDASLWPEQHITRTMDFRGYWEEHLGLDSSQSRSQSQMHSRPHSEPPRPERTESQQYPQPQPQDDPPQPRGFGISLGQHPYAPVPNAGLGLGLYNVTEEESPFAFGIPPLVNSCITTSALVPSRPRPPGALPTHDVLSPRHLVSAEVQAGPAHHPAPVDHPPHAAMYHQTVGAPPPVPDTSEQPPPPYPYLPGTEAAWYEPNAINLADPIGDEPPSPPAGRAVPTRVTNEPGVPYRLPRTFLTVSVDEPLERINRFHYRTFVDNGSCVSHRTADTDNDTRCSQCIRRGIMTCFYIVPHITCYPCGDDPCDLDTRDDTQDGRQTRGEIALLNNVPTEDAAQTHSYVLRRIGARYARLRTLTE